MKNQMINTILLAASFVKSLSATPLGQPTLLYFSYELKPEEKPGDRFWKDTMPDGQNFQTGYEGNPEAVLVGTLEFKDIGQVKTFQWSRDSSDETLLKDVSAVLLCQTISG